MEYDSIVITARWRQRGHKRDTLARFALSPTGWDYRAKEDEVGEPLGEEPADEILVSTLTSLTWIMRQFWSQYDATEVESSEPPFTGLGK